MRNLARRNQLHVMPEREKPSSLDHGSYLWKKLLLQAQGLKVLFNRGLPTNFVQGTDLELLLYWKQKRSVLYFTMYCLKSEVSFNELED